jgi:hypothetical protein
MALVPVPVLLELLLLHLFHPWWLWFLNLERASSNFAIAD